MAIKGYLSDIKFIEVLRIIGKYNGRLSVWNFADSKQYECFFQNSNITYINFNNKSITEKDEVRKIFSDLNCDNNSYYFFQNEAIKHNQPIVSVAEILSFSLQKSAPIKIDSEELPNLLTKFETVEKSYFSLQGDLGDFWRKTVEMFHQGCTGQEICNKFDLNEAEVQLTLSKLRTMGLIKPFRMFKGINPLLKSKSLSQNLHSIANKNLKSQKDKEEFSQINKHISAVSALSNITQMPPPPQFLTDTGILSSPDSDFFEEFGFEPETNVQTVQQGGKADFTETLFEQEETSVHTHIIDNSIPTYFDTVDDSVEDDSNFFRNLNTPSSQTLQEEVQDDETDTRTENFPHISEAVNNGRTSLLKRMLNSIFR